MESRALFREIHKNTWLRRPSDNRKTAGIKKSDKYWVVFCVHDDSVAYLEGYLEPRSAPSHVPEWAISLQNTLHISHSLVAVENEYEFVITLHNDVARFNAPSWDLMIEWVDALRSKLREMKILAPRENVYSKLPELRAPLLPTRDPTSPLPAPPPVPAVLVPGIESPSLAPFSISAPAMSNTSIQNIMNLLSNPLEAYTNNASEAEAETRIISNTLVEVSEDVPSPDSSAATNITIIQVSTLSTEMPQASAVEDYRSNVQIIPSNPTTEHSSEVAVSGGGGTSKPHETNQVTTVQVSSSNSNEYGMVFACSVTPTTSVPSNFSATIDTTNNSFAPVTNISIGTESSQHYEQVFLASSSPSPNVVSDQPSTSTAAIAAPHGGKKKPCSVQQNGRSQLTRGVTEISITRPSRSNTRDAVARNRAENHVDKMRSGESHQENRRRSSSTSDMGDRQELRRLQSPPQPFRSMVDPAQQNVNRMTLREQQVMQLRREMMHPGGVRLQLRRRDCVGSIGWVDAFGGVFVSGWKQKEHPVLYNALHIGDQLLSVAGSPISSATEANKVIRSCQGLFVEIIIRRVPFGRVYAIRRDIEGQCLGLIRDGNVIVGVVPNSLAARFGLPPKAKTVDGLGLTFWVLTEINSRPLNLFLKESEVKDRLNSVGRDISILVQPSDLVTKLKKQLKSLRGYKDFIVQ